MAWQFALVAGPDTITEGPAWDGSGLFYTSIEHREIRRYDPATGSVKTVYGDTHRTNGIVFGPDGSLYACEQDTGAITRYDASGKKTVLVSRFEGKRLNSPNDLALASDGTIWFTDPRYGDATGKELDHDSVYHIAPPASGNGEWRITRATFDTTKPNGILLSPDERTLYVAQSDYGDATQRQLRAYPISDSGTLGEHRVIHDFGAARGIDGMCWDTEGNIVATCGWELSGPGSRIAVFAPDGTVREEHLIPAGRPTNCTFGDADLTTLYVTTLDGHLYRVRDTGHTGALRPPRVTPYGVR